MAKKKTFTTALQSVKPLTELVYDERNDVFSTSLVIAGEFGKRHDNVLRDIENLDCSDGFRSSNLRSENYIDERGQEQKCYSLTEEGFMFLVMGYRGAKAAAIKEKFIRDFKAMKAWIHTCQLEQAKALPTRTAGKEQRKELTDAIKHLVTIAKAQGSVNSKWLYKHITNGIYKALGLFAGQTLPDNFRDSLTKLELELVLFAELAAANVMTDYFEADDNTSYKVIRDEAIARVVALAEVMNLYPTPNPLPYRTAMKESA